MGKTDATGEGVASGENCCIGILSNFISLLRSLDLCVLAKMTIFAYYRISPSLHTVESPTQPDIRTYVQPTLPTMLRFSTICKDQEIRNAVPCIMQGTALLQCNAFL